MTPKVPTVKLALIVAALDYKDTEDGQKSFIDAHGSRSPIVDPIVLHTAPVARKSGKST